MSSLAVSRTRTTLTIRDTIIGAVSRHGRIWVWTVLTGDISIDLGDFFTFWPRILPFRSSTTLFFILICLKRVVRAEKSEEVPFPNCNRQISYFSLYLLCILSPSFHTVVFHNDPIEFIQNHTTVARHSRHSLPTRKRVQHLFLRPVAIILDFEEISNN